MKAEDFDEFKNIYLALNEVACGNGQPPSKMAVRMFFKAVEGVSLDDFKKAATMHLRRSKWFPAPAEILEIVSGTEKGNRAIMAGAEWCKLLEAVKRYGTSHVRMLRLEPTTAQALRLIGGCDRLATMREDEEKWVHRDFVDAYEKLGDCNNLISAAPELLDALGIAGVGAGSRRLQIEGAE